MNNIKSILYVSRSVSESIIVELKTSGNDVHVLCDYVPVNHRIDGVHYSYFGDYIPHEFDYLLKIEGEAVFKKYLSCISVFKNTSDGIFERSKFHFINKVVRLPYLYKTAYSRFLEINGAFDEVIIDHSLHYLQNIGDYLSVKEGFGFGARELVLSFGVILYKLIFLPLHSLVIYKFKKIRKEYSAILFGNFNEIGAICNNISNAEKENVLCVHSMRRYNRLKRHASQYDYVDFVSIDHFITLKLWFLIMGRYVGFVRDVFSRPVIEEECPVEYMKEFKKFILYFSCAAIKYDCIVSDGFTKKINPHKVYFSYAHTWQINCINHYFKTNNITTYSSAHGLIQEPMLMTSEVDVCFVDNEIDLEILTKFSSDGVYSLVKGKKKNTAVRKGVVDKGRMRILVLGKLFYSDALPELSFQYFDTVRHAISLYEAEHELIDVLYRPHPREPVSLIEYFKEVFSDRCIEIEAGPFDEISQRYNLIIIPISTATIDLAMMSAQIMVYRSSYDSSLSLSKKIPIEITFCRAEELYYCLVNISNGEYRPVSSYTSFLKYFM